MPRRVQEIMDLLKGRYTLEIDPKGNFISFPPETRNFLGYTKEEILSMSIFDIVLEEDLETVMDCIERQEEIPPGTTYNISIFHTSGYMIAIKAEPTIVFKDGKVDRIKCKFIPLDDDI
jgi:PAS domain S-box-containing protein